MAIVSCPECGKKLKIADTSVGKKVKGPCGHVFVAEGETNGAPAPKPAAAVAPEKVYVGCTECGSKLKVATTSLGKKMKCPKCAAVFVANLPAQAAPAPVKKAPPPAPDDDGEAAPKPKGKAKPAVNDEDMDDLFSFAQADATGGGGGDSETNIADQEEMPKPKGKAKPKKDEDEDEDEPKPKGKPGKKPGKPPRYGQDDEEAAKPVYPSRMIPNILVTLLLLGFGGLVGTVFFFDKEVNIAKVVGLPESKGVPRKLKIEPIGKKDGPIVDNNKEMAKFAPSKELSEEEKIKAAKVQLTVLTAAAEAFKLKNLEYPKALHELVEGEPPFLTGKDPLTDPWKQSYLYDPTGPKNDGVRPDIWTMTPDKEILGNWPKEKAKDKKKDKDKKNPDDELEKFVKRVGGRLVRDNKAPGKPVIEANFDATNITDADLKILAGLKQLRKLTLASAKIQGAGLKELAELDNLEELDLSFSQFDDEGAKELAALKGLKVLSVLNSKVSDEGIKTIAELAQLQELRASQIKLTAPAIKELGKLKELRRLELGNTATNDDAVQAFGELENLEVLVLTGTLITDAAMKDIGKLKKLKELRYSFNITDNGLKELADLTEMRKLYIAISKVGDEGLKVIGNFKQLEELDLSVTAVSDVGLKELAGLTKLKMLHLSDTKITGPGLKDLAQLQDLRFLTLRNTKVSAEAVDELKKALPKCQIYAK